MKKIVFTVTNDLTYDQRMHRICNTLAKHGYTITLVGRKLKKSLQIHPQSYLQKRLPCWFEKGILFYAEYNIRLFFFLLFYKADCICAIDLDTILPCYFVSKVKNTKRVYDAHEDFTTLVEVRNNLFSKKIWTAIEKFCVPKFTFGYTVSNGLASAFLKKYHLQYNVIQNMPITKNLLGTKKENKNILYSGAVNEGRGFEQLIPSMKQINENLIVCGDGNFMIKLKKLIETNQLQNKIILKGMLTPDELWGEQQKTYIGVTLANANGYNQYYALPNKFFDYIQAGLPQIVMNFPEYKKYNDQYQVALTIDDLDEHTIANAINLLIQDDILYEKLHQNCLNARKYLCWEHEEIKLIDFYQNLFQT